MRRTVFASMLTVLFVTAAFARQSQTPPPTPRPSSASPTPTPQGTPVTATVTAGRSGMVVVERQATERQAAGQRVGGSGERMAFTTFIAPAAPTSWQNVKLDVKISDSLNTDTQHNKTMTVMCLDGNSSQVRSQSGDGLINIDARPAIRPDGRIYLQLILEYRPDSSGATAAGGAGASQSGAPRLVAGFSESLNLLVADGKPIVASQSADPRSDRKVTIEVTATVLK